MDDYEGEKSVLALDILNKHQIDTLHSAMQN